jgi:hypothetical protein
MSMQASGASVEGTLLSMIKRIPLKKTEVRLVLRENSTSGSSTDTGQRAITDDMGHFRFVNVPRGIYLVEGPEPPPPEYCCAKLEDSEGKWSQIVVDDEKAVYTFGRVFLADREELANVARFCGLTNSSRSSEPLGRKVLVLIREKGHQWEYTTELQSDVSEGWSPESEYLICVDQAREEVGTYGMRSAYRTTWQVRVVRLSDGTVWKNSFTEHPPASVSGAWSDPVPLAQLTTWLRTSVK